jgi:outer membrane receptor for ferric coprogen and ferric-rhodotorulic acid
MIGQTISHYRSTEKLGGGMGQGGAMVSQTLLRYKISENFKLLLVPNNIPHS